MYSISDKYILTSWKSFNCVTCNNMEEVSYTISLLVSVTPIVDFRVEFRDEYIYVSKYVAK